MSKYFKPISISLSPNVEKDDIFLVLKLIFQPWLWKNGKTIKELEKEFAEYVGVKYAISFNSGRSSLYAILEAMIEAEKLKSGDSVLLQAFTCNAVPNPVLWANLNPIYVDCSYENFNIDINDLINKIKKVVENGSLPKALILQHTFGLPANMDEIINIAQQNNLILIEDCAHSLGAEFGNRKVGTFGEAAFFSFSRDKVISSVYGGMAVTNNNELAERLRKLQKEFGMPRLFWVKQQLLHPLLLYFFILPVYNFLDLGKIFLVLFQWLHILSKAVLWKEKIGKKPDYFPRALPNALAILALHQFKKINKFHFHRKKLFEYYYENLNPSTSSGQAKFILPEIDKNKEQSYLRFTVKHKDANEIIYNAWHKENILLGDWYTTPVAPFDTNLKDLKYELGSCPNAESLAKRTLNLPTHINISVKDAERIINFLQRWK